MSDTALLWAILGTLVGLAWALNTGALYALSRRVEFIMGNFDDAVQAWVDYAEELKGERDQYAEALKDALATNAKLVAIDAENDAAQAAALQEQLTGQLEGALAALQSSSVVHPKDKPVVLNPGKQTDKPEWGTQPYTGTKDDKPTGVKVTEKPEFGKTEDKGEVDPYGKTSKPADVDKGEKGEVDPYGKVTEKPDFADPNKGDKGPKSSK
jgi:hypothetical protein